MLVSVAIVLVSGLFFGWLCEKIHIPSLFGMIIAGIIVGPGILNLLDNNLLAISADLRRIALIIILIRAGLKLNVSDLKKVGRPAMLMCFVPACCEVIGMIILAPTLLGVTLLDAAILGAVIGAVSPAVVVPRMIRLIDEGYGTKEGIPQMVLAGASVDDVFVIVLFTTFTTLALGDRVSAVSFINVPISILTGISAGALCGWLLSHAFKRVEVRTPTKVIILFAISFILNWIEEVQAVVPFAALLAIMTTGTIVKKKEEKLAKELSMAFDKLWVPAEIFLFVLVGASVAIESARDAGLAAVILILMVLVFRMAGVALCMLGTSLSRKERLFCMLAYTPKATVQAAIGGLPLAMGLACGNTILTVSVIAILLTAPLGAFAIDISYHRLLRK